MPASARRGRHELGEAAGRPPRRGRPAQDGRLEPRAAGPHHDLRRTAQGATHGGGLRRAIAVAGGLRDTDGGGRQITSVARGRRRTGPGGARPAEQRRTSGSGGAAQNEQAHGGAAEDWARRRTAGGAAQNEQAHGRLAKG
jgi:hypothetical protein